MTVKILRKSDRIDLPGLYPSRIVLAQQNRQLITFIARVEGEQEIPVESSIRPAPSRAVADRQFTARIRALEGL